MGIRLDNDVISMAISIFFKTGSLGFTGNCVAKMASTSFRIYENAVSQGPLFHITWCPGCQMKPNVKIYLQKVTMGELFRRDGNTHSVTSNGTQMFGLSDRGVTNSTFEIHNVFIACSNHTVLYESTAKCNMYYEFIINR